MQITQKQKDEWQAIGLNYEDNFKRLLQENPIQRKSHLKSLETMLKEKHYQVYLLSFIKALKASISGNL